MSASQAERRGFDPRLPLQFFSGPNRATDRHGSANSTTTRGTAFPRIFNGRDSPRTDGACEAGGGAERARPQAGGAKRAEFDSPLMGTGLEVRQGTAAAVGSVPSARGAKPPRRALSRPSGGSPSEPFGHARAVRFSSSFGGSNRRFEPAILRKSRIPARSSEKLNFSAIFARFTKARAGSSQTAPFAWMWAIFSLASALSRNKPSLRAAYSSRAKEPSR